jgi:hypothetical protein
MQSKYDVRPFGRDCLGNISGYVVARGHGLKYEVAGTYVGDIYEPGSFEAARIEAESVCERVNRLVEYANEYTAATAGAAVRCRNVFR